MEDLGELTMSLGDALMIRNGNDGLAEVQVSSIFEANGFLLLFLRDELFVTDIDLTTFRLIDSARCAAMSGEPR